MSTTGTITNFKTTPGSLLDVGSDVYEVETAGKSYNITNPDSQTLRFQVQQGDNWAGGGDGSGVDRSEMQNDTTSVKTSWGAVIPAGTPIGMDYQFMVEANGPNGSFVNTQNHNNGFFVVGQMHNDDIASGVGTSPPFAFQMDGDHLQIVARYVQPGGNPSNSSSALHMLTLWTDPNPIQTGVYNDIKVQANFSNSGGGYLQVSINGKQVVNYQGPLGYGQGTYWEYGVYRSRATETAAVDYRNMTLVTGSQAAGWTGAGATAPTQPTTPTSPTVTPAVTQASASPGTGIEHAGDTITLSLAFNEAVTVTGTPTLTLNDGGKATYVGGSGTSTLTFKTTVAATDTNTSALAITGVNLPSGSSIKDASGVSANLSGAVKTFTGFQIDPVLPAVTRASASPGTGTEHVADAITLTLGFNEAVTVSGTPTLSLNDGGTASYVGGSGTGTLTFKTTVASTNTSTSALAITGVNLPSGASIRDAGGVAANLSGAVKTFSGLQIDPTSSGSTSTGSTSTGSTSTGSTATSTPPGSTATKPVLTIADNSLSVAGKGGTVDLGTTVTTTDTNDVVTVNIAGLPNYERITDKLDGRTFSGKNITLTAAQVDSGLTLQSNYKGNSHPVATLTLTASAKDPTSGAVSTASPQTIAVTDPRPATTTTTPSTPTATKPVLNIADHSLSVAGKGGTVDLGTKVTTTDHNDRVTVNITGLPSYETITDKRDGHTFRGQNITLTAAQVDSGLELHSHYSGKGHPGAKLTLTANAKDPVTGAVKKAAPQTITVTDPASYVTTPVLTVADHTLSVTGGGGKVGLGTRVTTTDHNDRVTVNITGLPSYETITDKRDGHTFRGQNITLTAAQVDSGLILHSHYSGKGHPGAKLTLTANAKDPVTGAVKKAAPQTITVTDPASYVTTPVLTVADHTLSVTGGGGKVGLGTRVTTTDHNDRVTVNITGLPSYETITDKRDGHTFRGQNITLTAAQVDSGLELHSHYSGKGHPGAKLTLTANAKDPVTGAVKRAAPQTITVTDPASYVTTPVLTVADHTLSVTGGGGKVGLGTRVTTSDHNDRVTVNITGLPSYETITDKRDGHTFRGQNITLTAAQVDSGLELHSYYRGGGHPVATLALTASAKDPSTGAVSTASPQAITVTDPRPAPVTTTTSSHHHHHHTATDQHPAATTTAAAPTAPRTIDHAGHQQTTAANTASLASQGFTLLQQHVDPATSTLATTAPQSIAVADHPVANGTASFASQGFALLNQYLAAHTGQVDPGQVVAALSQAIGGGCEPLLARPQH
ncbi:heparin lyase I family protein [Bradyrhizobium sp. LLZ17]|uniref:Heparin lyase I family protein n=1 Tax=Bradyrhizobium sp. LLZ17 TaxID=3239388 RepID=A0AB39XK99_9BRAD